MNDGITGKLITQVDTGEKFRERFGAPYGVIHRGDLLDVLVKACESSNLITMLTSTEVEEFDEIENYVTVSTRDGRSLQGSALIAADGIWSKIRSKIVNDGNPIISGHVAYRAVLSITEVPEFVKNDDVVLWARAGPILHFLLWQSRVTCFLDQGYEHRSRSECHGCSILDCFRIFNTVVLGCLSP